MIKCTVALREYTEFINIIMAVPVGTPLGTWTLIIDTDPLTPRLLDLPTFPSIFSVRCDLEQTTYLAGSSRADQI